MSDGCVMIFAKLKPLMLKLPYWIYGHRELIWYPIAKKAMQIGRVEVSPSISCSGTSRKKNARLTEKALNKKHIFKLWQLYVFSKVFRYSSFDIFVHLIPIIQSILTILHIAKWYDSLICTSFIFHLQKVRK